VKEQFFGTEGILETERQYYQSHRAEDNDVVVKSKREITIEAVEAYISDILPANPAIWHSMRPTARSLRSSGVSPLKPGGR
jgi:hypothetical protein